jgi:hypothetical protein
MTAAFLILTALVTGAPRAQAQAPSPAPEPAAAPAPRPSSDLPNGAAAAPLVTVEGCVAAEDDVPHRHANAAERVGIAEDFILTSAKVLDGTAPAATADASGGVISNALQPMYEIGGLSTEQLKTHVGRRVRIQGTFASTERRDPGAPVNDDLVELNGTTIMQVQGACPALPRKSN